MPERRKMKSPSPKMTSTPKMKRKGRDGDSPTELQTRLGIKENLASKKEVSQSDAIDLSEYNDGTTRPLFKKRLRNVSANTGELAQLECVVSGTPLPKVLWLKNNRPLKAADGCKVIVDEGQNVLVFPSARDEDVGIYTARAMNVNGSLMASAEFTLNDGKGLSAQTMSESPMDLDFSTPTYFFQMSSCEVAEGRVARFDCRVVAYPRPEIVWMRDGKVVESMERFKLLNFNNEIYSLLIQDVQLSDTGRYTCWARNKFGEAMTEAYLNVIALTEQDNEGDLAPKFLTKFYDQQTAEGIQTDFRCLVAGRPEPSVTWLLGDEELRDSQATRLRRKEGVVSLEIKSPKLDQSGMYTCQLSNPLGDALCSAKLTVVEDKLHGKMLPKFLKKFDHVNTRESEEVKFSCIVVGEPKPDIIWMFDHKPISDTNRRYTMKKEGDAYTLTIKSARFEDGGTITCKAVNTEGEVYCSANLHIRESKFTRDTPEQTSMKPGDEGKPDSKFGYVPTFTKRLHDMEVKEGAKAMLECQIMGIPEPEVSWMRDGRVITPGGRYHMTREGGNCCLVIDNVSAADTGVYTCIISNNQGKSSTTAHLKLEGEKKERYTPDRFLDDRTVKKERYTPDKYLEDSYTTPAKRPYVELDRIEDETRRFADLPEMRAPPRLPTHRPFITDLGEETVRLAWQPAETYQSKRSPPVSYRLEAKELPGKDWMPLSSRLRDTSHYLPELLHDRDYMIRVRAENDYGISEPTESLWLPRARAFPGVPVTRPEIDQMDDHRARLSWDRVDIPAFGLDDTPLTYMIEVEEPPKDWRTVARDLDDTEYFMDGLKAGTDYRFRVRARTPAGVVSDPSPAVSMYTTLARSRAPVDRLEVLEYEPDTSSVRLAWQRVDIPPYNMEDEPLMYMLEYNEPPMPDWRPLVTGIPTTRYRVMHLDPERDYNFRVRAVTPYGLSPPSTTLPVSLRQTPATTGLPEAVIISDVQPDSVQLSWRRPMYDLSTPITYQIEMLEPPSNVWQPIAFKHPETSYKVTGLRPTKDYQFRVIPQTDTRHLTATPAASLTSSAVRPRLPLSEPTLKELSPDSVQLSWRPAEFPVYQRTRAPIYYGVEMQELPSSNWVPVARHVTDTSYVVTGLRPDHDYKFRVMAETDLYKSEPSLSTNLHRMPAPRFSRNEPIVRDINKNIVMLSWEPAAVPSGYTDADVTYRVEMQTPPGISTWQTLYDAHPTPSVRLADLRSDLDYLVRVRAQSGNIVTEPTMPVYIPRRAVPPRIPVEEPYVVEIQPDSIKLQWRSADLPSHIMDYAPVTYRLEARELPGADWVTVAQGIPHTDFRVTGLNPQRDYAFRVRAVNDYGMSDPTRHTSVPKRSVAPVLPSDEPLMYDVTSGSVRLSWRPATLPSNVASPSPMTYTIYMQELPHQTWRALVRRIPHTSYHVTGLRSDREYNFRVQAENEYGSSKPTQGVYLPRFTDHKRPISIPEVSDFAEDLTSMKLHWKPQAGSPFDKSPHKYRIETWEPIRRSWEPMAHNIPDTSYTVRGLPHTPDHLFRIRMETEQAALSEPSLPVSILGHYNYPRIPVYRPQLHEVDRDTVKLSWQPAIIPDVSMSRRPIGYTIEQREIPDTHWHNVVSDVTDTTYWVRNLRPKSDYEFRVRTIIDGTTSEPSFPVALYRRPVIPRVRFDVPEVEDMDETSLSLRWNKVDVPSFSPHYEPLSFMIERQLLPHYEWEPVATNITDSRYTVRDLKPHQDYNFRVRGVYPSGYTEPSPYVPVYRRPSESNLGIYGVDSDNKPKDKGSQKYLSSSKISTNQILPTQSLRSSAPSEFSPIHRISKQSRWTRSHTSSPQRTFSVSNIYDTSDSSFTEAPFRKSETPEPKFKLRDAYVYKRTKSPLKLEPLSLPVKPKPTDSRTVKLDKTRDLYEWYRRMRRHSDAGVDTAGHYPSKRRSERNLELMLEERRQSLILESERLPVIKPIHRPRPSLPNIHATSDTIEGVPSVADRYEDIKCPYIVAPGHWKYPRRRSISLDPQDLEILRKSGSTDFIAKSTPRRHRDLPDRYKSKTDLDLDYSRGPEYYDGTYFIIEDEVDFNDYKPSFTPHSRVSRVDMRASPSLTRSHSYEKEPGYFLVSKFSLSVSGIKPARSVSRKPVTTQRDTYVRPASLEPSPVVRQKTFRPASLEPTPVVRQKTYSASKPPIPTRTPRSARESSSRLQTRSMTPDLSEYRYRSRSGSTNLSHANDLAGWEALSKSISSKLEKVDEKEYKYKSMASTARSSDKVAGPRSRSPVSMPRRGTTPTTPRRRSRANSFSVTSEARPHFNRLVENSKSLISNYENVEARSREQSVYHSRAPSVAPGVSPSRAASATPSRATSRAPSVGRSLERTRHRSMSLADIKSDPRFSWTPRASVSSVHSQATSTPRGSTAGIHGLPETSVTSSYSKPEMYSDVKSDPRFSSRARSSLSTLSEVRSKPSSVADLRSDPRFTRQRRATVTAATNDDLKSKLDTLSSKLSMPKPKVKKSKPIMKYKSSRGEGFVMEDTWAPQSHKLAHIYHALQT